MNSIRLAEETSLRALCEVLLAAQASGRRGFAYGKIGQRDCVCVLREPVRRGKAAASSESGWRQNGRKRKRDKQGDPTGTERCSWPQGPKSRPAGVRASVVAKKRGNARGAKGTQEGGRMKDRKTEDKPTRVLARANQWWNQPGAIDSAGPNVWPTSLGTVRRARFSSTETH